MVRLSHQINRLEDGKRQRGTKSISAVWKPSATPRQPFFQRRNPPRPLAGHSFSVEVLGDPPRAIFSAWKCSATPRDAFFQRGNPRRPLATHFFSVEVLRDPSRRIFSAWKCSATPRGTLPTGKIRSVLHKTAQLLIINVKKVLFRNFSILKVCEIGITKLLLPA